MQAWDMGIVQLHVFCSIMFSRRLHAHVLCHTHSRRPPSEATGGPALEYKPHDVSLSKLAGDVVNLVASFA